jgi:hypothetical protein
MLHYLAICIFFLSCTSTPQVEELVEGYMKDLRHMDASICSRVCKWTEHIIPHFKNVTIDAHQLVYMKDFVTTTRREIVKGYEKARHDFITRLQSASHTRHHDYTAFNQSCKCAE